MTGHICSRGDAWELRVYVGVDAVTGKKRYAHKGIRGGKRDAERALVELAADAQRGKLSRTNTAVAELLDARFDRALQDFSPKDGGRASGLHRSEPQASPRHGSVDRLKAADLDRDYTRLLKNGGQAGQPRSPATTRRIHGILRRALQQAVRWGWIGANPAASASPPRVDAPATRPPRPDEVADLFRAVGDEPEFAHTVVTCGHRQRRFPVERCTAADTPVRSVAPGRETRPDPTSVSTSIRTQMRTTGSMTRRCEPVPAA